MNTLKTLAVVALSLMSLSLSAQPEEYTASYFGARSDGTTMNTRTIQKAVDFISENGGGTLVFYVGRYLTGPIEMKSNVTIRLEEAATLVGSPNTWDYTVSGETKALIYANGAENFTLTGAGVIDGRGAMAIESAKAQIGKGYLKMTEAEATPNLIDFTNCNNVTLDVHNLKNAAGDVVVLTGCNGVTMEDVTLFSNETAASNGFVITGSTNVEIEDAYVDVTGKAAIGSENTGLKLSGKTPDGKAIVVSK